MNNFKLKLYLLGQLYSESISCLSENSQDVYLRCHLIGFAQPSGIQWSVVGRKCHNASTYQPPKLKVANATAVEEEELLCTTSKFCWFVNYFLVILVSPAFLASVAMSSNACAMTNWFGQQSSL